MVGYEGGALVLQLVRLIINIAYLIVVLTCLLCFSLLLSTCIPLCAAESGSLSGGNGHCCLQSLGPLYLRLFHNKDIFHSARVGLVVSTCALVFTIQS